MTFGKYVLNNKTIGVLTLLAVSVAFSVVITTMYLDQRDNSRQELQYTKSLSMELIEAKRAEYETEIAICNTARVVERLEFETNIKDIQHRVDSMNARMDSILIHLNTHLR